MFQRRPKRRNSSIPPQITAEHRRDQVADYVGTLIELDPKLSDAKVQKSAITVDHGAPEDALTLTLLQPSTGYVDFTWKTGDEKTVRGEVLFKVVCFLSGRILLTDRGNCRAREFGVIQLGDLYRELRLLVGNPDGVDRRQFA